MKGTLAILTLVALGLCSVANAGVITGSVGAMPKYSPIDISTGVDDWVAYGGLGTAGSATDITTGTSPSSFSALSVGAGTGPYTQSLSGVIKLAHDAGYGTYPAATTSIDSYPVVANSNSLAQLIFTHTMLAGQEMLDIIVLTKNDALKWVNLEASLSSGGMWYVNAQELPTVQAGKGCFGIVTLDVSGASAGDTLTFMLSSNYSNNTNPQSWWGVGISAATTTVVPEPATMALLAFGGIAALIRRRR